MRKIELHANDLVALTREMESSGTGVTYRATLHGKSMLPFIRPGDTITVQPVKVGELRKGDILVFQRRDQALVAHRLVRIEQDVTGTRYITRGDSSLHGDRPRTASEILGKVVAVTRGGNTRQTDGTFVCWLAQGWVAMFPVPQRLARWWIHRVLRRMPKA